VVGLLDRRSCDSAPWRWQEGASQRPVESVRQLCLRVGPRRGSVRQARLCSSAASAGTATTVQCIVPQLEGQMEELGAMFLACVASVVIVFLMHTIDGSMFSVKT
jgi:hypothetical protein